MARKNKTPAAPTTPETAPNVATDATAPAVETATDAQPEAPAESTGAPADGTEAAAPADGTPAAADGTARPMPSGGLLPFKARNIGRLLNATSLLSKLSGDIAKALASAAPWVAPLKGDDGKDLPGVSDALKLMAMGATQVRAVLDRCPEEYAPQRKTITATFAVGDLVRVAADRCAPNTKLSMLGITADMIGKIQSDALAHKGGEGYLINFLDAAGNVKTQQFIGGAGLIKVQ